MNISLKTLAAATLLAGVCGSVRADVTLTISANSTNPQMQMVLGGMVPTKIYVSGHKSRYDKDGRSFIQDTSTGKLLILSEEQHQYMSAAMNPANMRAQIRNRLTAMHAESVKVLATGKTVTIDGHRTKKYVVTATIPPGRVHGEATPSKMTEEIYAAVDIPMTDVAAFLSFAPAVSLPSIHGVPLKVVTTYSGKKGASTYTVEAVDVSTAHIPASVFGVPSGYTQAPRHS